MLNSHLVAWTQKLQNVVSHAHFIYHGYLCQQFAYSPTYLLFLLFLLHFSPIPFFFLSFLPSSTLTLFFLQHGTKDKHNDDNLNTHSHRLCHKDRALLGRSPTQLGSPQRSREHCPLWQMQPHLRSWTQLQR